MNRGHHSTTKCREHTAPNLLTAILLLTTAFTVSCNNSKDGKPDLGIEKNYVKLTLYDSDYSLALSHSIVLDSNSISIRFIGQLVNENDTTIFNRQLTSDEVQNVSNFFHTFPLDSLENTYINPLVFDGDQKLFIFEKDGVEKQIENANQYQENLGSVILLLNSLLPDNRQIYYGKDY